MLRPALRILGQGGETVEQRLRRLEVLLGQVLAALEDGVAR
jgi:hypothetical protein